MYKVSIIVPVYNVEDYLAKCLDSLVNQTLKDIEIILVNDGSTDSSYEICKKYQKKYKDTIKLISKENEGQAIARNIAIKEAHGEYLMFVDSDDYIDKNTLKKMYKKTKECNADIVWCLINCITDNNQKVQEIRINSSDKFKKYILNNAGPCAKLIKKDLIIDNKLYFPKIKAYEDLAIVPAWGLYAKEICHMEEGLYYYLIRPGSTMNQITYNKKMEDIFYSLEYLYKYFSKNNKYKDEIEWLFIDHLLHSSSLRFFQFDNYHVNINKTNEIIKKCFPNWRKNIYYKNKGIKFKIVCNLFYKERYWLLKLILKRRGR